MQAQQFGGVAALALQNEITMIIRYNAGTYMIARIWLNIEYPTPISDFRSTVPTSIFIIPCLPAGIGRFNVHYSKDVPVLKRIAIEITIL